MARAGKRRAVDAVASEDMLDEAKSAAEGQEPASRGEGLMQVLTQARSHAGTGQTQYNAHPTTEEVTMLRTGYAQLLKTLRERRGDLVDPSSDKLANLIDTANGLHQHVHRTVDAALDARFMAASADLGAEKLHKLPVDSNAFSMKDLSDLLLRIVKKHSGFGGSELPYLRIGQLAERQWRGVMGVETMLGLVDLPQRQRQPRPRRANDIRAVGPAVTPAVLHPGQLGPGQGRETTDLVVDFFNQLSVAVDKAPGPGLPLLKVVTNPLSYAKTVESMFYLSFLVADHHVALRYDPSARDTFVNLVTSQEKEAAEEAGSRKQHRVLNMSMRQWRDSVSKYSLTEPLIKLE